MSDLNAIAAQEQQVLQQAQQLQANVDPVSQENQLEAYMSQINFYMGRCESDMKTMGQPSETDAAALAAACKNFGTQLQMMQKEGNTQINSFLAGNVVSAAVSDFSNVSFGGVSLSSATLSASDIQTFFNDGYQASPTGGTEPLPEMAQLQGDFSSFPKPN